ncbi:uncharacterized protein V6R79_018472 [Siganus canaliculatus]
MFASQGALPAKNAPCLSLKVTYMFEGKSPETNLQPPAKIRFPVQNTTKEIQCTICTIIHYFDSQVPAIIDDLVIEHQDMTSNINKFNTVFKAAVGGIQDSCVFSKECQVNVTTSHDFAKKIIGLEIIHFARKWVEYFTNTTCVLEQA